MSTGPTLAKTVWTQADFDQMSWHDNEVHAIAIEPALRPRLHPVPALCARVQLRSPAHRRGARRI